LQQRGMLAQAVIVAGQSWLPKDIWTLVINPSLTETIDLDEMFRVEWPWNFANRTFDRIPPHTMWLGQKSCCRLIKSTSDAAAVDLRQQTTITKLQEVQEVRVNQTDKKLHPDEASLASGMAIWAAGGVRILGVAVWFYIRTNRV